MPIEIGPLGDSAPGDAIVSLGEAPPADGVDAHVDLRAALARRPSTACDVYIRGRGIDGLRWAVHALLARRAMKRMTEAYGPSPDQVGDLRLPEGDQAHPLVVLVHGGGWRENWERDLMEPMAVDLTRRGYATWNVEYRRVGPSGGGFPQTVDDVCAAVDAVDELAARYPVDASRCAILGHSAGGMLSVVAAARRQPDALFLLAGALDLEEVSIRGTNEGSGLQFVGGLPHDLPAAYATASPLNLLPLGRPRQVVAYGSSERIDLIDGNRRYCVRAAELRDDVEEVVLRGADHFSIIDPRTLAWQAIAQRIEKLFPA